MPTIRILLLEDDLETVSVIARKLAELEQELQDKGTDIALTVLSEYTQVEQYINTDKVHQYDLVLLDRDCKAGGSFHTLDFEKIGVEKIISISSTPQWNEEAKARGVQAVVWKDYANLDDFSGKVATLVQKFITPLT